MTKPIQTKQHFILEADDFDPEDETVRSEEFDLDLQNALISTEAYRRGEIPVRVTEFVNGEPLTYWRFADGLAADRYRVVIEWNGAQSRFAVSLPELPGCVASGSTQEEALTNIRAAANAWMDTAVRNGHDIPVPASLLAAA